MSQSRELSAALEAAQKAGKVILKHYGTATARYKSTSRDAASVVTDADVEAERIVAGELRAAFPQHNIYGEENARDNHGSDSTWYIDPIDGTANFLRRIPLFGVSIGLVKGDLPVAGVLYFPALELLVHGERGNGAYADGKRISVSSRPLAETLYYSGGYSGGMLHMEPSVANHVAVVRVVQASSYALAQIAMGDAELYILRNVPHDVAAGIAIVHEAGGKITDYEGAAWKPQSSGVVVSNRAVHEQVLGLLRKEREPLRLGPRAPP